MRTPLAWRNLTHQPRRVIASLGGIVFAVLLMFMQRGFQKALLDSTTVVLTKLDGELIMLGSSRYMLAVSDRFPLLRLAQAEAIPGVRAARPLYIEALIATYKNPETGADRKIRVFAYNPSHDLFAIPEVRAQLDRLAIHDAALMDERSKPKYGEKKVGLETELTGRRLTIVGMFRLGTDFANDGTLIMSDANFTRYFGDVRSLDRVDLGIIRLEPWADPIAVRAALAERLPADVKVLTKDEVIAQEKEFWASATPIGFIFGMGTLLGFLVGLVVCYQVLYGDVVQHLREFATLKAIGYRNRDLLRTVLEQAVLLAGLGFVPGLILAMVCYRALAESTGLVFRASLTETILLFVLTVGMSMVAGLFAVRKAFAADPAELF